MPSVDVKPQVIQNFKVEIHESTILRPYESRETETKKPYFLSNLDQDFNFPIPTVHFFSANPDFPIETVVKRLKLAVQKVLVPYDFIAGTSRKNPESGHLEIDCNGAGVGFVVASSQFSLDEIGDLVCPNPDSRHLVVESFDHFRPNPNDHPLLCAFQVTSFKCGGFAMGFTINHICVDAVAARAFVDNLASQAFEDDKPLAVVPCHDRHLLAARSPPRVEFPHPELITADQSNNIVPVQEEVELVSRVFELSSNVINYLKDKATNPSSTTTTSRTSKPIKITSFNVVAALVWRCKSLSTMNHIENDNDQKECTMNIAVDVRSRLNLPSSYCGNAIIWAYASLKRRELEEKPFSEIVGVISDSIMGLTDEYVRSTIDWYDINKGGRPNQGYFITAWWKVGFEQVVYPWGKPIRTMPIDVKNVCILLPYDNSNDNKGLIAVVTLPAKEMETFETLFYDFLKN